MKKIVPSLSVAAAIVLLTAAGCSNSSTPAETPSTNAPAMSPPAMTNNAGMTNTTP